MMRVLDLFSGIGGFSLGLERAGMSTVAFCEINPFCRRVLAKHWPEVPIYDDIRALTAERLASDGVVFDLICGGFPCQDLSVAGKGAGLSGERSGLWFELQRIIEETRPGWALIENVPALRSRGLDQVLGGLSALGYDAEWHCVPASAVGAPHRRDRVWLVAHADIGQCERQGGALRTGRDAPRSDSETVADAPWDVRAGATQTWAKRQRIGRGSAGGGTRDVADAGASRLPTSECETILGTRWWEEGRATSERGWWSVEPDVGRVAHGVPARVDRLRSLGNAVVSQIPEQFGRAIIRRVRANP